LDPGTRDEDESALVRAIADARTLVDDTLETARWRLERRGGAEVEPGEQGARDVGLRPGFTLYRAAVWWLLDKGALVPDREANEELRNTAGTQHCDFAFKITKCGLDMLRRA